MAGESLSNSNRNMLKLLTHSKFDKSIYPKMYPHFSNLPLILAGSTTTTPYCNTALAKKCEQRFRKQNIPRKNLMGGGIPLLSIVVNLFTINFTQK